LPTSKTVSLDSHKRLTNYFTYSSSVSQAELAKQLIQSLRLSIFPDLMDLPEGTKLINIGN
jgi:hypothetical protein